MLVSIWALQAVPVIVILHLGLVVDVTVRARAAGLRLESEA